MNAPPTTADDTAFESLLASIVLNDRQSCLLAELDRDPACVVARLSRLHAEETRLPEATSKSEFYLLLEDMMMVLGQRYSERGSVEGHVLIEAGIFEAITAIIASRDFFLRPVEWRCGIASIFFTVLEDPMKIEPAARGRICRTAASLCKSIWDNRDVVRLADHDRDVGNLADEFNQTLPRLVQAYYALHGTHDIVPGIDTYLHHAHLFLWILSYEEKVRGPAQEICPMMYDAFVTGPNHSENLQKALNQSAKPEAAYLAVRGSCWKVRESFVQECIVEGIGADRFVAACEAALQYTLTHLGSDCANSECGCNEVAGGMILLGHYFVTSEALMPTVYKRDLLACALNVLKPLLVLEFGSPKCIRICAFCLDLVPYYYFYSEGASMRTASPHMYPNIIDVYISAVQLVAGGCITRSVEEAGHWSWTAFSAGLTSVSRCIKEDWDAKNFEEMPEYILALKDRGAQYWWPALRRLRFAINAIDEQLLPDRREHLNSLLKLWVNFGALIGLNDEGERQRHEREQLQRCWRIGCNVRQSEENHGTVRLLKCAGCGDVRYCSKKCQRLDWTKGGHKKMCRRLK